MCVCGAAYLYLKSKRRPRPRTIYSPDTIIRVLRRFRRNYYPIYKTLSGSYLIMAQNHYKQFGTVPDTISKPMYLALTESNPKFRSLVETMESRVYSELGISDRASFEVAAEALCATDSRAMSVRRDIQSTLRNVCSGGRVSLDIPLADHITPELTFKIYKETVYTVQMNLNDFMAEYVRQVDGFSIKDPGFLRQFHESLRPAETKQRLLRLYKFDYSEDYHQTMVYDSVVERFLKNDPKYAALILQITELEKELLRLHLQYDQDYSQLRERIEGITEIGENQDEGGRNLDLGKSLSPSYSAKEQIHDSTKKRNESKKDVTTVTNQSDSQVENPSKKPAIQILLDSSNKRNDFVLN